ncbi:MAG: hypothetical protein Fur0043_04150 [Anaerolineales bacterium]
MFRRRPVMGRPLRPLRRGTAPQVPLLLQHANQLMAGGQYAQAAQAFESLAEAAQARGGPRAPLFFLQAGRARFLEGKREAGLAHVRRGLSLLAERADWRRLHHAGERVLAEMHERGLDMEAAEIEAWLKATLPAGQAVFEKSRTTQKPQLPTHCPSCGAALRLDEVEWLDEVTAECAYCGSPVR